MESRPNQRSKSHKYSRRLALVQWGIKIPQKILGLKVDGIVGEKTITAVNNAPANFLQTLYKERQKFLERIAKTNPTQKKFLRGWLNRLDDLKKWNTRI